MKIEDGFSRAFIDLARIGRTDWRSVALTILLVKSLDIVIGFVSVIAVASIFSEHRLLHITDAEKTVVYDMVGSAAYIFGLWLACNNILRRPFRSLISTDMTFDIRRCLLGAALYLPANALGFLAMSLFFSMRAGSWVILFGHFEWPQHSDQIFASVGMLLITPFAAFAEELVFRGWLTQTLKHYIGFPIVVVALVAVLFAAYHTQYDLRVKMLIMINSFGLSVLSLRDQRLELAIGVHLMMNVFATLQSLFFTGSISNVEIPPTMFNWCTLIILKGALPFALMYGVLQKTGGWFAPTNARLARPGDVQPGHV